MTTGQSSKPTRRLGGFPALPPGMIPAPRSAVASAPQAGPRPARRNAPLIAGVVAVAAVIGVTALVATSSPTATPVAGQRAAAPVQLSAADVGFLKTVRQQAGFAAVPDDSLIKIGRSVCDQLRGGTDPDQIALPSTTGKYSDQDVDTALGAAAGAYCPDQMPRLGITG